VNLREFFAHWAMVASLETIGRSAHNRLMRLAQSPEDAQRGRNGSPARRQDGAGEQ